MKKIKLIKNITTNIIPVIALSFIASSAQSQTYNIPKSERDKYIHIDQFLKEKESKGGKIFGGAEEVTIKKKSVENKVPYFSPEQIRNLEIFLANDNYVKFYDYISALNVENGGIIRFLISKSNEGHIPLFWLLSNFYAEENDAPNTHKWLYVALIMTTQDTHICTDRTALIAPKTLLREFPTILNLTNRTPQYIEPGMIEASTFIKQLRRRTSPNWACSYGTSQMPPGAHITLPPASWKQIRDDKMQDMMQPYTK